MCTGDGPGDPGGAPGGNVQGGSGGNVQGGSGNDAMDGSTTGMDMGDPTGTGAGTGAPSEATAEAEGESMGFDDPSDVGMVEQPGQPAANTEAQQAEIDQMHAASNPRGSHNDPNLVQINLNPTPYGQNTSPTESETAAAFRSDTDLPPGSFMEALSQGYQNAQNKYGAMMTVGSAISGLAGFAAAMANAPEGSMAGDGTSDPSVDTGSGDIGGFDQQTFDTQAAYDARNLAKQVEKLNPPVRGGTNPREGAAPGPTEAADVGFDRDAQAQRLAALRLGRKNIGTSALGLMTPAVTTATLGGGLRKQRLGA